jgi:peptide/nickel transport system permease protein
VVQYAQPIAHRPLRLPAGVRRLLVGASWLVQDRVAMVGAAIVLGVILVAIFAPQVAPHDPARRDILQRLKPPAWVEGSDPAHVLGTDALGRDILSRVIFGARISLLVGFAVVVVAGVFGTVLGMVSGFYGGRVDQIIMRLTDIQTAFPGVLLVLAVLTMVGPSILNLIFVLSLNGWMVYARMARGQVLSMREQPFVEAAVSVGCRTGRVIFSHVLPNLASPLLTLSTLELARIILTEATVSFLGIGVQPPDTSWGLMIAEGQDYIDTSWWLVTLPGLAVAITVLAVNLLASWLRTAADPVQRYRQGASGL